MHRILNIGTGALLGAALLAAGPASAQKPPPLAAPNGGSWFNYPGKPPPLADGEGGGEGGATKSGSGFVVAPGRVLTNNHVVRGCARLVLRNVDAASFPGRVDTADRQRDLALISVSAAIGPPLTFRDGPPVQRGETVVTYGFPLSGFLSSEPILTTGNVNALAGIRDNPANLQIQAPVQPGNSGGPLLDGQANVIGVVVEKLDAARIAEITGDIPQNVNFAVKGTEALAFLRANGVQPRTAPSTGPDKRMVEIGQVANPSTVHVLCYR